MAEECDSRIIESTEKADSASPLNHNQSTREEISTEATSKLESRADEFSHRIKQYPYDELKVVEGKSLIGSGGFGDVRKYHHRDKLVAVKEFAIAGDEETITRIWDMVVDEANILCRFQHKNIVEILGITQYPNVVGIIMEFVNGGNLQSLLSEDNQSELTWKTRLDIANGITSGLDYIHNYDETKTFCHGDIKPANVLLTQSLQVKLADFGSAGLYHATAASTSTTTQHVAPDTFTVIYVAPEFLENNTKKRNPAMDMYSFGSVLFELISGKPPYSDSSMPSCVPALIMAKIKPSGNLIDKAEIHLKSEDDRGLFSFLKKLMQRCWENDPKSRPSSKTVKAELGRLMKQQEDSSSSGHESQRGVSGSVPSKRKSMRRNYSSNPAATKMEKMRKIFNALGVPLRESSSDEDAAFDQFQEETGAFPIIDDNASAQEILAEYTNAVLNNNFNQADAYRAALRAQITNDPQETIETVMSYAKELLQEEKFVQLIAVLDTAAALAAQTDDLDKGMAVVKLCVQGIAEASKGIVHNGSNMKIIVSGHVIPLMRSWVNEMKSTSQVSMKWRCSTVSAVLSGIGECEILVDQSDQAMLTLEEATNGMREVFGDGLHRLHGQLYGNMLHNLGCLYGQKSRVEEAAELFEEAIKAHRAGMDYFGDEEERRSDIMKSERCLKGTARLCWERQLQRM